MEIKEKVRGFLGRYISNKEFADTDNIFEGGLVNSLFIMQLVMYIEKEFGVTLENEDLELEKFKDVNSIVELIEEKSK